MPGILACSALKKVYRRVLLHGIHILDSSYLPVCTELRECVKFVHLTGTRETLRKRLMKRTGHYMPSTLLDSQLATLEVPDSQEKCITADISQSPEKIVQLISEML